MRYDLISINWTAQRVLPEQLLVLRNIAALSLRKRLKNPLINFTHELIEGVMTRKSEGTFVTFVGTFFHADMGTVNGERWTVDFLLPKGSENVVFDDTSVIISTRPLGGGQFEVAEVKKDIANVTEASLLQ